MLGVALTVATLGLSCTGVAAASQPATAARLVTMTIPDRHGEIPSQWLNYPGPPRANVLLPAHYDPQRRYPLLLLLGGLQQNYDSYLEDGIVNELERAGLDAIVVMPEGASGWYTDWWNNGARGAPAWESYELDEVIPTILARYPILPGRQYHAVAGFSMGGLGATYLGGRLPGFFGTVGSLSGFVDPEFFAQIADPGMGLTSLAPLKGDTNLYPVDGPPRGFYDDGHNPTRLAVNLQDTRVFESTGTGVPSTAGIANALSGAEANIVVGSVLESLIICPMSELYDRALTAAGVDVTFQVHPGGHDIPDFYDEMTALLKWGLFGPVVDAPTSWVNDTVATAGQLWDVGYRFDRPPDAVVRFRQVGSRLSISSAGSAVTLTTSGGCVVHAPTPATVALPNGQCT